MSRLLMLLSVILLLALLMVGWATGPGLEERMVPGVWLWDVPLARKTPAELEALLPSIVSLSQPNVVLVGPEGQRWAFSPADLGMSVDTQATVARAYAVGHSAEGVNAFAERVEVMANGVSVAPVLVWDPQVASEQLEAVAAELARDPSDAHIEMEGRALRLEAGSEGRRMEITPTLEALLPALHALQPVETVPVMTVLLPEITNEDAERALDLSETILSKPLTLLVSNPRQGDPGPWTINPEVMANMLVVRTDRGHVWVGLDEAALADYLGTLAMSLYKEPQDARFHFGEASGELVPISESVTGREVDVSATITRINTMLQTGEHFIPLAVNELPPAYPDDVTAEELGIRELTAVGASYFTGSSSARDRNIRLGASQFDGIVIAPGQTFSFNEYLGDVTAEKGYDESYVIIGNRTVPGVGGGICQVATTAFRAAFYGGYPIVERWPHAYRVGYYELGGFGPGFDATIYSPLVDFRFTNDTPHHILIQTEVDMGSARLRFLFYSTPVGRDVEQIGPTWGNPVSPGAGVYEFDPSMPAGTVVQIERSHDGLSAALSRIVRDAEGNVLYEDTFVSNFVPWPARYRYGPDFTPPPDAEVVTPEPESP